MHINDKNCVIICANQKKDVILRLEGASSDCTSISCVPLVASDQRSSGTDLAPFFKK